MKRWMIIPAAGMGTRLKSQIPKVLFPVNGMPMIDYLRELYSPFVNRFLLVVHPSFETEIREHIGKGAVPVDLELQTSPTGMLDAILIPAAKIQANKVDQIWITWCDQIAVNRRTVQTLAQTSEKEKDAEIIFPTIFLSSPYIHFVRNEEGKITGILHRREGDTMPPEGEGDLGLFCLSRETYLEKLRTYASEAEYGRTTSERNFLPFVAWLSKTGKVMTFKADNSIESLGINDEEDLRKVQQHFQQTRKLSVVIPAYNEEQYIGKLLELVLAVDLSRFGLNKEIIVVNDCSTDRTEQIVRTFPAVRLHSLSRNSGKGEAVKNGFELSTGDYIMIQDADLEYDPKDYVSMLDSLFSSGGDVIYGSRYLKKGKYANQSWGAYLGGRSLSLICFLFTGHYITDTVTALKLFRRHVIKSLDLKTSGFELDHEISARVLARDYVIREVPISYFPRSKEQGKKIGARDWFRALKTFSRFRNG